MDRWNIPNAILRHAQLDTLQEFFGSTTKEHLDLIGFQKQQSSDRLMGSRDPNFTQPKGCHTKEDKNQEF